MLRFLPDALWLFQTDQVLSSARSAAPTCIIAKDGAQAEYPILDGAFLAHCRLRRWQGIGLSGMIQDT
ncbi:hypothetical protein D3227_39345 [Mesorhizobium waimense]|uniref:Uncharacterized protein n=1 Tax=Mesorhizobium waimense TaxID=1300307 RepID=A0A3A5K2H0_9HYPH|nr:hypothetical protein D3227_39345 [Mesorhizobium waimense]